MERTMAGNPDSRNPTSKTALSTAELSGEIATDIRALINGTRLRIAQTANAELVLLNWKIG